jgi:hypothetical protein
MSESNYQKWEKSQKQDAFSRSTAKEDPVSRPTAKGRFGQLPTIIKSDNFSFLTFGFVTFGLAALITSVISSSSYENGGGIYWDVSEIYGLGLLVCLVLNSLWIWQVKRSSRKMKENLKRDAEIRDYKKKELARIKSTMTPAQWDQYQLDMEIKENLERLQRNSNTTTTTTRYGMFGDFGS